MNNNNGSFVAISDFHSYDWPLDKIKDSYLNKYEHIYILGDATDRGPNNDGTGGVNLLLGIMDLSKQYPNQIHYIPGNHDDFLYKFMISINKERNSEVNIINNGGKKTIVDIDYLYNNNIDRFNELLNWLGTQKIQHLHIQNNTYNVLAHAFFDCKVFDNYPDMDLKTYNSLNDDKLINRINNILWFRKINNDYYDKKAIYKNVDKMIVGHTPASYRNESLDLIKEDGSICPVICVDGGIIDTKTSMEKYDGSIFNATCSTLKSSKKSNSLSDDNQKTNNNIDTIINNFTKYFSIQSPFNNDITKLYKNTNKEGHIWERTPTLNDELLNQLNASRKKDMHKTIGKNITKLLLYLIITGIISSSAYYEIKKHINNDDTTLPDDEAIVYIVQENDYLSTIAKKYNTTIEAICKLNGIDNPNHIEVGEKITIIPNTIDDNLDITSSKGNQRVRTNN